MRRAGSLWLLVVIGCAPESTGDSNGDGPRPVSQDPALVAIDLDRVPERPVREGIQKAYDAVLAEPDSANAWGQYGDWLNQYSYSREAALAYDAAAWFDPDEFLWSYRRACVLQSDDPETALAVLNQALTLDDGYAPAHVRRAALELELGHEDAAREALALALQLDAASLAAHLASGRLELASGHPDQARPHLEQVIATRPDHREVHELLARMHHALGDADTAREHLDKARALPRGSLELDPRADVALGPVSSRDHVNEGARLAALGKIPRAIQHFQEALRLNEDFEEASFNLALAYIDSGLPDEAIRVLREGLVHNPDSHSLGVKLGDLLIKAERYDEARVHFEDLVQRVESWLAHKQLGFLYGHAGQVSKSMEQTSRALELNPEHAELWYDHGLQVLTARGRNAAIPEFQKALTLDPALNKARFRLAVAMLGEEQYEEGIVELRELRRRSPDHPKALSHLQFACERAAAAAAPERPREAITYYEEILSLHPEARFQRKLAWLLSTHPDPEIRDPARALELAQEFAPEDTRDPVMLDTRAAALAANGQYDEAAETGRQAHQMALGQNKSRIARRIRDHLDVYQERRPFLEAPSAPSSGSDPDASRSDDG